MNLSSYASEKVCLLTHLLHERNTSFSSFPFIFLTVELRGIRKRCSFKTSSTLRENFHVELSLQRDKCAVSGPLSETNGERYRRNHEQPAIKDLISTPRARGLGKSKKDKHERLRSRLSALVETAPPVYACSLHVQHRRIWPGWLEIRDASS